MTVDMALDAARRITSATTLPVSIDFERGYARDAAGVRDNIARLIEAGAAGLNIEDSLAGATSDRRPIAEAAERVAAVRAAADAAGVPLAINARTDTLAGSPDNWDEAIDRAAAHSDVIVLAQASMATAADTVSVGVPVLTSIGLGIERLAATMKGRSS